MTTQKTTFDTLASIDCSKHVEKKNGLTYLSWAWAWSIAKANFPDANYQVIYFDGKPYLHDEHLGYMVATEVTIQGETIGMHLPVMDGANKAQKHIDYKYEVAEWFGGKKTGKMIEKEVTAASMFDINTGIMRCLTKNLAMFGLGHYIYAGEDLPQVISKKLTDSEVIAAVGKATTIKALTDLWNGNKPHSEDVKQCFELKKNEFVVIK